MLVKNIGSKIIGFGTGKNLLIILPGETQRLPTGYDERHPSIQMYLKNKFIEIAQETYPAAPSPAAPAQPAVAPAAPVIPAAPAAVPEPDVPFTDTETAGTEPDAPAPAADKVKSVNSMTLAELRVYAAELGIQYAPGDTKAVLKQKIAENHKE